MRSTVYIEQAAWHNIGVGPLESIRILWMYVSPLYFCTRMVLLNILHLLRHYSSNYLLHAF